MNGQFLYDIPYYMHTSYETILLQRFWDMDINI